MRVLDLFSGIGGFALGLERAGFQTVAFCEADPFCRHVLNTRWPNIPVYDDVKTLTQARLETDGISVDVICGGFPCQDISTAGRGAGLRGERSGLWYEFHRLIAEIRPRYVIIENVSALRSRGLDQVLRGLFEIGYDAEWHCIPAAAIGAPHRRDRIWIIAYTNSDSQSDGPVNAEVAVKPKAYDVAYANNQHGRAERPDGCGERSGSRDQFSRGGQDVADTDDTRCGEQRRIIAIPAEQLATQCRGWWSTEPDVGRVANGVPNRTHRLRALGNAVVPQIPQILGEHIIQHEGTK